MNKNINFTQLFIISRQAYWYIFWYIYFPQKYIFPLIKIFFWDKSVSSVTDFTSRSGQRKICHSKSFVPSKEKTSVESILVLGLVLFMSFFLIIFLFVPNDPLAGKGIQNLGMTYLWYVKVALNLHSLNVSLYKFLTLHDFLKKWPLYK